jgi:hypothetical protein
MMILHLMGLAVTMAIIDINDLSPEFGRLPEKARPSRQPIEKRARLSASQRERSPIVLHCRCKGKPRCIEIRFLSISHCSTSSLIQYQKLRDNTLSMMRIYFREFPGVHQIAGFGKCLRSERITNILFNYHWTAKRQEYRVCKKFLHSQLSHDLGKYASDAWHYLIAQRHLISFYPSHFRKYCSRGSLYFIFWRAFGFCAQNSFVGQWNYLAALCHRIPLPPRATAPDNR